MYVLDLYEGLARLHGRAASSTFAQVHEGVDKVEVDMFVLLLGGDGQCPKASSSQQFALSWKRNLRRACLFKESGLSSAFHNGARRYTTSMVAARLSMM
eukprot:scaffold59242_cov35-Prasinocladus_malaysianus.AAC.1